MSVVAGRRGGVDPGPKRSPASVVSLGRVAQPHVKRDIGRVARAGPAAHFHHVAQLADGVVLLAAFPIAYLVKTRLLPADLTQLYDPEVYIGPAALVASGILLSLGRRGAYEAGT